MIRWLRALIGEDMDESMCRPLAPPKPVKVRKVNGKWRTLAAAVKRHSDRHRPCLKRTTP